MATKDQIKLVKASHRRIKELLQGKGIEARVSYTSDNDMLVVVCTKRYKRLAQSLKITRCTSMREISTCPEIIDGIVSDVLATMPQQKAYYTSPEAFCDELDAQVDRYNCAINDRHLSRCIRVADATEMHIVVNGRTRGYTFAASNGKGGRNGIYPLPLDYEAADAYFVDLMDKCTSGGYSRWVAAGMPKKFDPAPAHDMTWSQFLMDTAPRAAQAISPAPAQDNGVSPPLGTIRYMNRHGEYLHDTPLNTIQGMRCINTWIDEEHVMPQDGSNPPYPF